MTLAGNQGLLERLVEEHLPEALRFAVRLTGCGGRGGRGGAGCVVPRRPGHRLVPRPIAVSHVVLSDCDRAFHDHLAAAARQRSTDEISDEIPDPRGEDPAAAARHASWAT